MRELGLTASVIGVLANIMTTVLVGCCVALPGCQKSEPAQATPPSSAEGVAGPAPTSAGSVAAESRVYDETARAIDARTGERFVIALKANVTTPFEWRLEPEPNAAVVVPSEHKYTDAPPQGCSGCVGYGGTDSFAFVAKAPGEADLHFAYRQITKKDVPPNRTVDIHVRVASP